MLTSIFQWLTAAVGGMMDVLVNVFIDALDMSMGAYLDTFPLLATVTAASWTSATATVMGGIVLARTIMPNG